LQILPDVQAPKFFVEIRENGAVLGDALINYAAQRCFADPVVLALQSCLLLVIDKSKMKEKKNVQQLTTDFYYIVILLPGSAARL